MTDQLIEPKYQIISDPEKRSIHIRLASTFGDGLCDYGQPVMLPGDNPEHFPNGNKRVDIESLKETLEFIIGEMFNEQTEPNTI